MQHAQRFDGRKIVGAAFTVAVFGWGLGFYGPPIYLKAVQDARGWPVGLVSAAVTVHFLAGVLVMANLPSLHRRFGLARVTFCGAAVLAAGVFGWAIARQPWQLFVATFASGAGWVTLGAVAINAIVAPWFVHKRPAALSMAYNGASIGGVVFSPLWVALIAWVGFPVATLLVGLLLLGVVGMLAATLLGRTPEQCGQHPDDAPTSVTQARASLAAPLGNPWRDRAFLTLAGGMALALFAQIGLIAHLFSLLVPVLGASCAGLAGALATLSAIAGRTLVGWAMPEGADRRVVVVASLGVQLAGVACLLMAGGQHVVLLLAGVVLFGMGIGNATSLPPLIAQAEFARADVQRAVALVTACAQAAYAFAPGAFGLLRDAPLGSGATAVFLAAGLVQLLAAATYLAGRGAAGRRTGAGGIIAKTGVLRLE